MTFDSRVDGTSTRAQQVNPADWDGKTRFPDGKGKSFPWKQTEEGQIALCLLYIYCRLYATDDDMLNKKPTELGIDFEQAANWMALYYKKFFTVHIEVMGHGCEPHKLASRYANMMRANETRSFALGREHPKNHPLLKPVLIYVQKQLKEHGWQPGAYL